MLAGEELREEARKRASEEGREDMEELFRSMAKRGRITLSPVNPDFEPIVLASADEGSLQVIAEVVEVLGEGT